MDVALVTGAASGLGLATARHLVERGFRVYGLGGDYSKTEYKHAYFVPTPCELSDVRALKVAYDAIAEAEPDIVAVVNNAKVYTARPFAETQLTDLDATLSINLLAPMALVRMALPSLQRLGGIVVNVAPTQVEQARGGPIGAASSGGLKWFGEAVFEELRDHGVAVTTVFPQANRWRPADAPPPAKDNPQSAIDVEAAAELIARVVSERSGNVATEVVLRPQRVIETPVLPPLSVPYPAASEKVVQRSVVAIQENRKQLRKAVEDRKREEAERLKREKDRLRRADEAVGAARKELRQEEQARQDKARRRKAPSKAKPEEKAKGAEPKPDRTVQPVEAAPAAKPEAVAEEPGTGRRRRRRGRNRGRPIDTGLNLGGGFRKEESNAPKLAEKTERSVAEPKLSLPETDEKPVSGVRKRRKPAVKKAPEAKAQEQPKPAESSAAKDESLPQKSVAKKTVMKKAATKKPAAKKAAAKKAVTKKAATKKVAAKKTTTKKVATKKATTKKATTKKATTKKAVTKKTARKTAKKSTESSAD